MTKEKLEKARKERNRILLERMRDLNDNLAAYDGIAKKNTPKPKIQKDKEALAKLYGEQNESKENNKE